MDVRGAEFERVSLLPVSLLALELHMRSALVPGHVVGRSARNGVTARHSLAGTLARDGSVIADMCSLERYLERTPPSTTAQAHPPAATLKAALVHQGSVGGPAAPKSLPPERTATGPRSPPRSAEPFSRPSPKFGMPSCAVPRPMRYPDRVAVRTVLRALSEFASCWSQDSKRHGTPRRVQQLRGAQMGSDPL